MRSKPNKDYYFFQRMRDVSIFHANRPPPCTVFRPFRVTLLPSILSLSITPGLIRALMFNPALTTQGKLPRRGKRRPPGGCASERMKTQRFSYFAGFAARRPAAAGQFRPVFRGGTSCFVQGETRKPRKSGVQPLFRQSQLRELAPAFARFRLLRSFCV